MTLKQLEARGWVFHQSYAEKDFLGGLMVVPYDKKDSAARVAKTVSDIDTTMQNVFENAAKFTALKELIS